MRFIVKNIHSIESIDVDLNGIIAFGGLNGSRKSTVLEMIFHSLYIYNKDSASIIREFIKDSDIYRYSEIVLDEEINIDFSDPNEALEQYNKIESKIRHLLNLSDDESEFFFLDHMKNLKNSGITYSQVLKEYLKRETLKRFRKYDFSEEGIVQLIDNNQIVFQVKKEDGLLKADFNTLKFETNDVKSNSVNFRNQFSNLRNASRDFINDISETDINFAVDSVIPDYDVTYDKDRNSIRLTKDGITFPESRAATGLKVFIYLDMLIKSNNLEEGDFIILDEPDVHLHTKWQKKLVELLNQLSNNGIIVIFSTHNELTITKLIEYSKDKTKIYHLYECSEKIGVVKVSNTILDPYENELLVSLGQEYYEYT